jgi:16S rRNA (cytosine967-C5)-methyltransferase
MRLGGRLAAAIELLDLIDTDPRPADMLVREYFRSRRYAGSGDRRMISGLVYSVVRNRGMIDWRLTQTFLPVSNRLRVFLEFENSAVAEIGGEPHAPDAPSGEEAEQLRIGRGLEPDAAPENAQLNLPEWLPGAVRDGTLEVSQDALIAAFSGRAATDIRVNLTRTTRSELQAELAEAGVETTELAWVPTALRLSEPAQLENLPSFRAGKFEVQDAGSQYVAHLLGAKPGERVADICAGAGGKTLALADTMAGEGILFASDIDGKRLRRLQARAVRAGHDDIEAYYVGANDDWPDGWAGTMDRVLVDAPCSGSGTWRRQPEQRWRFAPERLKELSRIQASVLDRAAKLTKPGGRLVYATCSFLRSENETAITNFLDRNAGFSMTPWTDAALEASLPLPSGGADGQPFLRLSPFDHGVDGFFAAVMTRAIG